MTNNFTIGFTCGVFDLMNAGHVIMLERVKNHCDYLIVGLQTDPTIDRTESKSKPIQSIIERQIQLKSCKFVDEIIVYEAEADLEEILETLDINIRFMGIDHKNGFVTGEEICKRRGIEIIYLERGGNYSSSDLKRRVREK